MTKRFSDKVTLGTGADGGIGKVVTNRLADQGATVVARVRRKEPAKPLDGVHNFDRKPRPVAIAHRELPGAYGQISPVANAGVFALTRQPAQPKVYV